MRRHRDRIMYNYEIENAAFALYEDRVRCYADEPDHVAFVMEEFDCTQSDAVKIINTAEDFYNNIIYGF